MPQFVVRIVLAALASLVLLSAQAQAAAPTASAGGPYAIDEGQGLSLDASASTDADGRTLRYAWDIDNDGQYDDSTDAKPTLTWAQLTAMGIDDGPASRIVKLQASAGGGGAPIDANWYGACAVRGSDKAVVCWGYSFGTPTGEFTQVSLATHNYGACGIRPDASLSCWGQNNYGQLSPPTGSFKDVSVGNQHACGVSTTGELRCWGVSDLRITPLPTGTFASVAAGMDHACALSTGGAVSCWGHNNAGETNPPAGTFTSLSAFQESTCGVKTDGSAVCWGDAGNFGTPPAGPYTSVSVGYTHACGLKTDGSMACWSNDNSHGQATPRTGPFRAVVAGAQHTCVVRTNGNVECWGYNDHSQTTVPFGFIAAEGAGAGESAVAQADLTVSNVAPTALTLSDNGNNVAPNATYTLRAQATEPATPDRTDLTYVIDWGDDSADQTVTGDDDLNLAHTYAIKGTYDISVTVDDADAGGGTGATDTHSITVNPLPAVATDASKTFAEGTPWTLSATGTDPEGETLTYTWDLNNDGTFGDATGAAPTVSLEKLDELNLTDGPATLPIKVRVVDAANGWGVASSTVTLTNAAPSLTVSGPSEAGQYAKRNYTFTLDDAPEDEAGTSTFKIDWDGNGTVDETVTGASPKVVERAYSTKGAVTVKATAVDKNGAESAQTTHAVTVIKSLSASAAGPYAIDEGQPLALDGSGSADLAGRTINYAWDVDADGQYDDATGAKPTLTWAQLGALGINDGPATKTVKLQTTAGGGGGSILDSGYYGSCALKSDAGIACWGNNHAAAPAGSFTQVSTFNGNACAIKTDSTVACWGWNNNGETTAPSGQFTSVSVGSNHSCAVRTIGALHCWGYTGDQRSAPPSGTFTSVSAGDSHTCALRTDGTVACWNHGGTLSSPAGTFKSVAVGFGNSCGVKTDGTIACWYGNLTGYTPPSGQFASVATGADHACGVKSDGTATCWGSGGYGQTAAQSGTFAAVGAGYLYSCGIRTNGSVLCWGYSGNGQTTVPLGLVGATSGGSTGGDTEVSEATLTVKNVVPSSLTLSDNGNNVAPDATYTLRAVMTDPATPDLAGVSYVVDWGDGRPIETIAGDNDHDLTHKYAALGTYTVSVTVKDKDGGEGPPETKPVVVDTPPAVTTDATRSFAEASPWSLSATGTDAEGQELTYAWDLDNDGAYDDETGATPELTYAELDALDHTDGPKTIPVKVKVTDTKNGFGTASSTITLTNVVPAATATGPSDVVEHVSHNYTFTADDASPEDDAAGFTYAIDWDGGGTVDQTVTGGATKVVAHDFTSPGAYTVKVTATDKNSGTSTVATHAVTATRSLTAAAAGPYSVDEGQPVSFDASGTTDLAGRTVSYAWDVDGDGQYDDATGAKPTMTWAQLSAIGVNDGPATKTVKVQASAGGSGGGSILDVNWYSVCAVKTDANLACWGNNQAAPAGSYTAVDQGPTTGGCGVKADASVACWGANNNGHTTAPAGQFSDVAVGYAHSCGVRTSGALHCWGSADQRTSPLPTGTFQSVVAGESHTCGLRTDGTVACWGFQNYNLITAPAGTFKAISAFQYNNCFLRTDGTITCTGELATNGHPAPSGQFIGMSVGWQHGCGLKADGSTTCWGVNNYGEAASRPGPYRSIHAGGQTTCGVRASGTVECFGRNFESQLSVPFGLTAASGGGTSGADSEVATAQLTVNNVAPTTLALSDSGNNVAPNATYTLRAVMSDPATPDLASVAYVVDWGDGVTQTIAGDNDENLTHTFTTLGDYTVSVTVKDKDGATGPTRTETIRVNTPPSLSTAAAYTFDEASPWALATESADAESEAITYAWDLDNDGAYDDETGASPELTYAELDALDFTDGPRTLPIKVKATDAASGYTIASSTVTLVNVVPVATATGPTEVSQYVAKDYTFTATDPSPEDRAAGFTYRIDWDGNGTVDETVTGTATKTVSRTFTTPGSYTIKATATDKNTGASTVATHAVTVARSLTAVAGGPYSVAEGQSVALDGSGSSDLSGRSISYAWDIDGDGQYDDATGAKPTLTWAQLSALGVNDGPATKTVKVQASAGGGGGGVLDSSAYRSCVVKSDASLACWGGVATPPSGSFSQVSAGYNTSCAIRSTDKGITCWGSNGNGEGNAPTGQFTSVSVGSYFTCAVRTTGALACWGYNGSNVLSAPSGSTFTSVTAGNDHVCAMRADGTVACWGSTSDGRGISPSGTFKSVDAGHTGTCGVKTDGTVSCWGYFGGYSVSLSGQFASIAAGYQHACALKTNGTVQCAGGSNMGQWNFPAGTFRQINAGYYHTCGVKTDSSVVCWGYNSSGNQNVPAGTTAAAGGSSGGDTHVSEATLNATNTAPSELALSDDGNNVGPGQPYTLRAVTTDPSTPDLASGVKYEIDWDTAKADDEIQTVTGDGDENLTHTFAALGSYTISVKVTDKDGGEGPTRTKTVKVNTPPALSSAATYTFDEGSAWALAATGEDAEADAITYAWDLDNDGAYDDDTSATPDVTRAELIAFGTTFTDGPSTKTIKVKATDAEGGFSTKTSAVTVANAVPTLTITPPATLTQRASGSYTFAVTDPSPQDEAGTFSYAIDWEGDGTFEETASATKSTAIAHTYATAGDYTIKAKATDKNTGVSEVVSKAITVRPVLVARAGGPYTANEGSGVSLDASGTTDAESRAPEYAWDLDADGQYDDATGNKPSLTAAQLKTLGLDDGPATRNVTVQATAKGSGGATLDTGRTSTCLVQTTAALRCYGFGEYSSASPPAGSFSQIAVGYANSCGLKSDKTVACWGYAGYGVTTPPAGQFKSVTADWFTACGVKSDSTLACWGWTGNSSTLLSGVPSGAFTAVELGESHACAIRAAGTVACWGYNTNGSATAPAGTFKSISAQQNNNCGIKTDGTVACWGYANGYSVTPPAGTFSSVSAGMSHSCGIKADSTIACWGDSSSGKTSAPAGSFAQVSAGQYHTCGVRTNATVVCWGYDGWGQVSEPNNVTVAAGAGGAADTAVASAVLTIDNVAPSTLALTGTGAAVRNQPYTLNASMTDVVAADEASGVKYKVDWDGDGTTDETVTGDKDEAIPHTFTSGGTFTVSVTVEDKDGGVGPTKTHQVTVTVPFDATTLAARDVTETAATLAGEIDPGGEETSYRFEYGSDTSYGTSTTAASAGAGDGTIEKTHALTNLAQGTTYHYRAVAIQGSDVTYGADETFTTLRSPVAVTGVGSATTAYTADLAGTVDPNGTATSYVFEYGETTAYGEETDPASAGSGDAPADVGATLRGLKANTKYYVRLVAVRGSRRFEGAEATFTTPAAPTVTTGAARDLEPTSATLVGTFDSQGEPAHVAFDWGTEQPYTHLNAGETLHAAAEGEREATHHLTGLTPGTTYHFRINAGSGAVDGDDVTFTTPELPGATTGTAKDAFEKTATLVGQVDANGSAAKYRFEYGTTDEYGSSTTTADGGSGTDPVERTADLTDLAPGATYHYRLVATKGGDVVYGDDATFTMLTEPRVGARSGATPTHDSASLESSLNANGTPTTYWFEYGETSAYGTTTPEGDPVSTNGFVATADISSLKPDTEYAFRIVAARGDRRWYGPERGFMTLKTPATATTATATDRTPTSATLRGTIDPNGFATDYHFEYGTDETYGTTTETLEAGDGADAVAKSAAITGLTPDATYHFRIVALRGGTVVATGDDATFTAADTTDPTITLTTPADDAEIKRAATVEADFACSDEVALAAADACVGTAADGSPIDTATLGEKTFAVTAKDAAGNTATTTHTYTVVNVAPVADAGGPYTLDEGGSLTLDGSSSDDPDGDALTYGWDLDGDGDFDDAAAEAKPQLSAAALTALGLGDGPKEFTVKLRVTDADSAADTATADGDVDNVAPTVTFDGAAERSYGESATTERTFDYTITDPGAGDTVASVATSCGTGGDKVAGSATNTNSGGTFKCVFDDGDAAPDVTVAATDDDNGVSATAKVDVEVKNLAPTVTLSDAAGGKPADEISWTASLTDPSAADAGGAVRWFADWDGDGTVDDEVTGTKTQELKHTYTTPGAYTLKVYAADKDGTTSETVSDTILVNAPPTADAGGPYSVDEGGSLTLDGSGSSDPEDADLDYGWELDGDDDYDDAADAAKPTLDAAALTALGLGDGPKDFAVKLKVTDPTDQSDTDSTTGAVVNVAPTVTFDAGATATFTESRTVTRSFSYAVSDPGDDTVKTVAVSCGNDGELGEQSAGSFTCVFKDGLATSDVTAAATDSDDAKGATDTVVTTITNVAPTVSFTGPATRTVDESGSAQHAFAYTISDSGDDTVKSVATSCGSEGAPVAGSASNTDTGGSFKCVFRDGPAVSTVTAEATDSDDATGKDDTVKVEVTVDNAAPSVTFDGAATRTVDESGSAQHTFTYAITDPGVDTITAVKTACGTGGTKVSGSDQNTDNGGSFTCVFPDGPAKPTVTASATDSDSAESLDDSVVVTVTNVAPTVTFAGGDSATFAESTTAKRAFTYTVSDPGDDTVTSVDTSCGAQGSKSDDASGSFKCVFADGPESSAVSAKATDSDTATGAADTIAATIDNVAPTLTFDAGDIATFTESKSVKRSFGYTVSDPGDDTVKSVAAGCGDEGAKSEETTGSFKCVFDDGPASSKVTATATDSDDAAGATDLVTVSVTNVAPTVSFDGPATRTVDESGSVQHAFAYTITDPGDDTVGSTSTSCGSYGEKVAGSASNTDTGGSFKCVFPDGPAISTVTATATDSDGATSAGDTVKVEVTVSNVAPTVTLDGADTRSFDEGSAQRTFTYAITDPGADTVSGVATSCGTGGTKVGGSDSNTNSAGSFKCVFRDGPARPAVTARATDSDGATGADDSIDVTVNNVAPTVSFADETRTVDESRTAKHTFTYTVSDPGEDTATVETSCGTAGAKSDDATGSFKCVFADGPASSAVSAKATDSDGAAGATDTVAVTVRNVGPTVTFEPVATAYDESGTDEHTFSYTMSDPGNDTVSSVATSCGSGGEKVAGSATNTDTTGSFRCRFLDGPMSTPVSARATDSDNTEGPLATVGVTVSNVAPTLTSMVAPATDVMIGKHYGWTFTGTDPSPIDQASLKFVVDWGDGLTDTKASPMTHAYALPGDYTVTAKALDKDGGLSAPDSEPEYAGGMTLAPERSGVAKSLMIGGTAGDDEFVVKRSGSSGVAVATKGAASKTFTLTSTHEIVLSGSGGDDKLVVEDSVTQKAIAFGGAGDDVIELRNSDGILVGGTGADQLVGDTGREMLYGGSSKDDLDGKTGEDVVVAGRVLWERAAYEDRRALQALREEWLRKTVSFALRLDHLRGTSKGSNGTTLLQTGTTGRTVFDDVSLDTVKGGTGSADWLLVNTALPNPVDVLVDKPGDDTVNDLAGS